MNKNILLFVIGLLVIGGGAFLLYSRSMNTVPTSGQNSTSVTPTTAAMIEASPTAMMKPSGAMMQPSGTTMEASSEVQIQNFAFNPATITVKKGATVKWTNNDSMAHNVTANDGSFKSPKLNKGESFSFTFNKTGTFDYICSIHPNMKAKVIVE